MKNGVKGKQREKPSKKQTRRLQLKMLESGPFQISGPKGPPHSIEVFRSKPLARLDDGNRPTLQGFALVEAVVGTGACSLRCRFFPEVGIDNHEVRAASR